MKGKFLILSLIIGQILFWEHYYTHGYFDIELIGHETYGLFLTVASMIGLIYYNRKQKT